MIDAVGAATHACSRAHLRGTEVSMWGVDAVGAATHACMHTLTLDTYSVSYELTRSLLTHMHA